MKKNIFESEELEEKQPLEPLEEVTSTVGVYQEPVSEEYKEKTKKYLPKKKKGGRWRWALGSIIIAVSVVLFAIYLMIGVSQNNIQSKRYTFMNAYETTHLTVINEVHRLLSTNTKAEWELNADAKMDKATRESVYGTFYDEHRFKVEAYTIDESLHTVEEGDIIKFVITCTVDENIKTLLIETEKGIITSLKIY